VRGQSPRGRIERKVIVLIGSFLPWTRRNIQGQHEFPALSRIVQEGRRLHMWRRLLRRFCRRRNADLRRTIRQRNNLVLDNDLLDLMQPVFIGGKNRLADQLLLFNSRTTSR